MCNKDKRVNTGGCYVSVSLSVFTISNLTTVEKRKKTDAVIYCGLIADLENQPPGHPGPVEEGLAGGAGRECTVNAEGRGEERKGKERGKEDDGVGDLWIISLLSLHRLIHKGCLCVCQSVCECYYKSPVHLADTLSRLSHHILLLLPM